LAVLEALGFLEKVAALPPLILFLEVVRFVRGDAKGSMRGKLSLAVAADAVVVVSVLKDSKLLLDEDNSIDLGWEPRRFVGCFG
jgi:hypothetical protein